MENEMEATIVSWGYPPRLHKLGGQPIHEQSICKVQGPLYTASLVGDHLAKKCTQRFPTEKHNY